MGISSFSLIHTQIKPPVANRGMGSTNARLALNHRACLMGWVGVARPLTTPFPFPDAPAQVDSLTAVSLGRPQHQAVFLGFHTYLAQFEISGTRQYFSGQRPLKATFCLGGGETMVRRQC